MHKSLNYSIAPDYYSKNGEKWSRGETEQRWIPKELSWAGRKINSKRFHTVWSHLHNILEITKWYNLDDKLMFSRSLKRSQDERSGHWRSNTRAWFCVFSTPVCSLWLYKMSHLEGAGEVYVQSVLFLPSANSATITAQLKSLMKV